MRPHPFGEVTNSHAKSHDSGSGNDITAPTNPAIDHHHVAPLDFIQLPDLLFTPVGGGQLIKGMNPVGIRWDLYRAGWPNDGFSGGRAVQ